MRLNHIELIGFKSFADKTEIHFDQGVTCVVGPNGCGKSNISDAIRWDLGERSAKLLRGTQMEDVIFNGTDFRKPLAMTEVSLTIDNQDRGLPIDYQEVTLTRRLYRNGESEYMINRTLCRLKDIQDLILDTGIGSNSYSMIEQGRIDYILSADAEERRFLIEEAAGISKYKVRKEEAIRKLERTEENRKRLNDIVHEVHKNIQYAERQARRAERYKEKIERLKTLEITKAFDDLGRLALEKSQLCEAHAGEQEAARGLESQMAALVQAEEALGLKLKGILDRYTHEDEKRRSLQFQMEQISQELRFHQEKRLEMAGRRGEIVQELREIEKRAASGQGELESKRREGEAIRTRQEGAGDQLRKSEDLLKNSENKLAEIKERAARAKSQAFEAAARTSSIRNELYRLSTLIESTEKQGQRHDAVAHRLREEIRKWEEKLDFQGDEHIRLERECQAAEEEKSRLDGQTQGARKDLESVQEGIAKMERELQGKETRLQMLLEWDRLSKAGEEALLNQVGDLEKKLSRSLRDIFKVKEGYEWALEAALEYFANAIVTENLESAEKLMDAIRHQRPSPIGLLIREQLSNGKTPQANGRLQHPSVLHSLEEVVEIEPHFATAFQPFLHGVYVAEALPTKQLLTELLPLAQENRLITRDGFVLGPHGKILYRNGHLSAEENVFQRRSELASLQKQCDVLARDVELEKHRMGEVQNQLRVLSLQSQESEAKRTKALVQKESFDSSLAAIAVQSASLKQELKLVTQEAAEGQSQSEEAEKRISTLSAELAAAEASEKQETARQEDLAEEIADWEDKRNHAIQAFAETRARFESAEERHRLVEESLRLLAEHHQQDEHRRNLLQAEAERMLQREADLEAQDAKRTEERAAAEKAKLESEKTLERIREEKQGAERELAGHQSALQKLRSELQDHQSRLHQGEMKQMDLTYREKTIHERFQQSYRIRLSELSPGDFPCKGNLEEMQAQIEELREAVESIGTVNLLAIEEYEEMKKRYDFLLAQQKDLDDARESLMETIRKINRTTKGLFEQTFVEVQKTFQEYYQTLFRGGVARLVLLDEANPLESGIDIVVRPPGKKLQHISLLSGGEKALTAIALLFALFKIKPSPFCVLDEVDAPLDEANIDRFLSVLNTFLSSCQFIIVTHNRKTIAVGNTLYGVTMEEPGISKIVSVKVQAESPAPAQAKVTEHAEKQAPA